jgi:universal stress protein E
MEQVTSILLGVDFSPSSTAALKQAVRIATWHRASIRALHVVDTVVMADMEFAMAAFQVNVREGMVDDARRYWARFSGEAVGAAASANIPLEVELGNPVMAIADQVRTSRTDLLILGMQGGTATPGAGTIAAALVRRAPAPTLLVRASQDGPFKTVVVGVDFSETSARALAAAARFATQDGAALHVVHVYSGPWRRLLAGSQESTPQFKAQYADALQRKLEAFGGPMQHELAYCKPLYRVIDESSHGRGLTEYCTAVGADLVVLGTRGRTNLRDMVMGSTAERVVRDAPCSVLAIKPEEK